MLRTESTSHRRRHDPHFRGGKPVDPGQRVPGVECGLGAAQHDQRPIRVEPRGRGMWFEIALVRPARREARLDDRVGSGECVGHVTTLGSLTAEDVAGKVIGQWVAHRVEAEPRSVRCCCARGIDDGREGLLVYRHQRQGVLRDRLAFGDHERHRLAREHDLAGDQGLVPALRIASPRPAGPSPSGPRRLRPARVQPSHRSTGSANGRRRWGRCAHRGRRVRARPPRTASRQ